MSSIIPFQSERIKPASPKEKAAPVVDLNLRRQQLKPSFDEFLNTVVEKLTGRSLKDFDGGIIAVHMTAPTVPEQPAAKPGSLANPLPALEGVTVASGLPTMSSTPAGKGFSRHHAKLSDRVTISFSENDNGLVFADTRVVFQLDGQVVGGTTLGELKTVVAGLHKWLSGC